MPQQTGLDELDEAIVTAIRRTDSGSGVPIGYVSQNFTAQLQGRAGNLRTPLLPAAAPPAPEPLQQLDPVEFTAQRPGWWQRFNNWLRRDAKSPNQDLINFTLQFYVQSYTGGGLRLPRLSRSGPRSILRQRGFVGPAPEPQYSPEVIPKVPKPRKNPDPVLLPEPEPMRLPIRTPVLYPYLPPGYEYDPDFHPDLVSPAVPTPSATPVANPAPFVTPSPSPAPRPAPAPTPSPSPAPVPVPRPAPTPTPAPSVTPLPLPRPFPAAIPAPTVRPNPSAVPFQPLNPRRTAPSPSGLLSNLRLPVTGRVPMPVPTPFALPQPQEFAEKPRGKGEDCECPKKKKKKSGPKNRKVCYEGKFREYAAGLYKFSKKEIPCQSSKGR